MAEQKNTSIMDTIKGKLGLGPKTTPQENVNAAATAMGGKAGSAVNAIRNRQAQIDAEMDKQLGMVPPKK